MKIRTSDALSLFGGNAAELARAFRPPITRFAVAQWGDYLPALRAHQLVQRHPEAAAYIEGEDGTTPAERAAQKAQREAVAGGERAGSMADEVSRG